MVEMGDGCDGFFRKTFLYVRVYERYDKDVYTYGKYDG